MYSYLGGLLIYLLLIKLQKQIISQIETKFFNKFSYNFMIFDHAIFF
jgi:hypothetical protein